jgi:hypothetical protein
MSGAPSDERSGLSFVVVIIHPLLVNTVYTDLHVMHMLVTYIYIMYKAYVSPGWEQQIMYNDKYMIYCMPYAIRGSVCLLENCQWCSETFKSDNNI